jgi:WD40 repeat protein
MGGPRGFLLRPRRLRTGSADHTLRLWDVATGKGLAWFPGHANYATAAAFSPDGRRALGASSEGSMYLWELPK